MAPKSRFQPGDVVRLILPGSKLHGTVGTLKHPRPPVGWWLVEALQPLELEDGTPDADRSFIAPDAWLELVARLTLPNATIHENGTVTLGVEPVAEWQRCGFVTSSGRHCTRSAGHTGRHATHGAKGLQP